MTYKAIEKCRQRLREIQVKLAEGQRLDAYKELARELGAGSENTKIVAVVDRQDGKVSERITYYNSISESELVGNINNALQTELMITMCRTATTSCIIALLAVAGAAASALAAWFAVLK